MNKTLVHNDLVRRNAARHRAQTRREQELVDQIVSLSQKLRNSGAWMRFKGRLDVRTFDAKTGLLRDHASNTNIVTLVGMANTLQLLPSILATTDKIDRVRIGSGITTPTESDTNVTTTLATKTITSTSEIDESGLSSNPPEIVFSVQFDESEGNGEIAEAALLFASGDLFNHALLTTPTTAAITAATKASPCVITSAGHGLSDGQRVKITSVAGMTQLNGNYYYVDNLSSSTFALYSDSTLATPVDSSAYSTYTSGGQWNRVVKHDGTTVARITITITLDN